MGGSVLERFPFVCHAVVEREEASGWTGFGHLTDGFNFDDKHDLAMSGLVDLSLEKH
jgi:hypothetical protein